jgi:subtilisin family serine protease
MLTARRQGPMQRHSWRGKMSIRSAFVRLLLSLVLTTTLVTSATAADRFPVDVAAAPPPPADAYVPDQLLVRFDPSISRPARAQLLMGQRARLTRELPVPGLVLADLPTGSDVPGAAQALRRRPGVVFAEPNFIYQVSAKPNDPRFDELWGLDNPTDEDIDAPEAWDITTGSTKVTVAVVDTGVDYTHPDLASNIWTNPGETIDGKDDDGNGFVDDIRGWDFVGDDNNPMDQNGHGTHVAGTIGARGNNGAGVTGVNWRVRIMAVRAGSANGSLTSADITNAFGYACSEGARVINGSFGGPGYSQAIRDAIDGCPQALFVVAAGNGGGDGIGDDVDTAGIYPCRYASANLLCVAASGPSGGLTAWSNYSSTRVDLAAPGESILSASYQRVLFGDGFESGLGNWTAGKASGKSWSRTSESAASGTYSATDSAGANYANFSDTWLRTSSPISLAGGSGCELSYAFRIDTEADYDGMLVEGSSNGGASWTTLTGWTGTSNGAYLTDTVDLKAEGFDGAANFALRFRLLSDYSNVDDGVHVDNVLVRCRTGNHGSDDYVMFSGTSQATPHVAGVAALVLAAHPNLTTATLIQAILDGVDPSVSLSGLVATGGRLNALGALEAVETIRPVAAAPRQRLISNAQLTPSAIPLRVSWAAATDAAPSSGILNYRLQLREKSGAVWGAWTNVATTSSRARTVKLEPGTYKFRLRAQDRAGNWSVWKVGSIFKLQAPQGKAIAFGGAWSSQTSTDLFGGSSRYTGTRGRTALLSFTGRDVAWVAVRGPNRGRAKVFIDGVLVKTVDLYSANLQYRRIVFHKRWSSRGPHTIEIKVTTRNAASAGSRVDLDAYVTLN